MSELWLGCTSRGSRAEVARALRSVEPFAVLSFADDATEMRSRFREEEPQSVGAIVGLTGRGVSDVNLAAALAQDGLASEVFLVGRQVSGSLRSRASRAGIDRVIDLDELGTSSGRPGGSSTSSARGRAAGSLGRQAEGGHPLGAGDACTCDNRPAHGDATGPGESMGGSVPESGRAGGVPSGRSPAHREGVGAAGGRGQGETGLPARGVPAEGGVGLPAGERAPVLAFASGRGGVGKTSLVASAAAVMSSWGLRVALVDLDLGCGDLHTRFGVGHPVDLARLAGEVPPTPEQMGRGCVRCMDEVYLWGPCERPETAELVSPLVRPLISYLSSRFDVVLVDGPAGLSDAAAQAAQLADRLVLVHDDRQGGLAALSRTSALAVRLGVARTRIVRVRNMDDLRGDEEVDFARIEPGLEGARLFRVPDGGEEAEELFAAGETERLLSSRSEFSEAVSYLMAQLLAELGALPDGEETRHALELKPGRRRRGLFGLRREVG